MSNIISKAKKTALTFINPELRRPESARLIITANCNFKCQMCTFWGKQHEDPSLDTVKYWISELADFGIKEVDIGGGEPFLRQDLPEIIKEIKAQGMKCGLTTNGWFLGGGTVPFPDIDFCEVSVDGAKPETHDKIRGMKGAWERAIKTVELAKKNNCPVHLNLTLQSDNYLELVDFANLAKKMGVSAAVIPVSLKLAAQPWIPSTLSQYNIPILEDHLSRALKTGVLFDNREFLRIFLRKLKKGASPQKCLSPYRCILIFTNGDVYPCGNLDVAAGNLSQGKKLKDVYKNYRKLREEIASGCHEFCSQCVYPDITTNRTLLSSAGFVLKNILKK
ncbi:MAG: radical SAM protein [bacterium]|nr:radical SAM protein [bacterium]